MENNNVVIFEHPLIKHKISILRDINTGTNEFRKIVEEIAMLEGFEALSDLPTENVEIKTPLEDCMSPKIAGPKLAIVPILRAGLGMVPGITALVPSARVGHIGLYRDPETLKPVEYYCKLPEDIAQRQVILLDPMIATGGRAIAAVDAIKKRGCTNIKLMVLVAVPEGIERIQKSHPDVDIYVAAVDERMLQQLSSLRRQRPFTEHAPRHHQRHTKPDHILHQYWI